MVLLAHVIGRWLAAVPAVRKTDLDGPCAARNKREGLPLTWKYRTQWTPKDCVGFLERKNIYDTLRYDFYPSGNAHCILFKGFTKLASMYQPDIDVSIDILFIPFVYTLRFQETDGGTIVFLQSPSRQENTCVSEEMIDAFFLKELDAVRIAR